MKRIFRIFETVFDGFYLSAALFIGLFLLLTGTGTGARVLAGIMALVLVFGDAFHLLPRIAAAVTNREESLSVALGRGKQVTSITMTVFYLLLWQLGMLVFSPEDVAIWTIAVYFLAGARILLCLLPQNRWQNRNPPVSWGILRNVPFFIQGSLVAGLFLLHRDAFPTFSLMGYAIILSFAFYLPVVLWSNRYPMLGMLMLPKTCAYLWMLIMCLSL